MMMKLYKRIVCFLMVMVMMMGMIPITIFADENEENQWNGKSAVFVGDSITAGTGTTKIYYEYLKESLGLGSVSAMGVPGSCISDASDYGQKNQPLINRYLNIPSADLIVIFMGTNDYGHETPLGSIEDKQDGTFCGALNTIVPALVANVVVEDGWVGFVFKYRDETQSFDLSKPLTDYITIEVPHTHEYASEITAPTCTEQGYTTYTCACGNSYADDYVDALGHPIVIDKAVAPTCTATGLTEGKHCSVCGEILVKQEIVKANGHSFTNYVSDKNATIYADGTKTAKCDHCDETDTVTDEGSKLQYIRGDVNGDETLNSADAIYLLRHTIMPMLYPFAQPADMNGDGVVNSADAIYLLRHTIMPDLYPLR